MNPTIAKLEKSLEREIESSYKIGLTFNLINSKHIDQYILIQLVKQLEKRESLSAPVLVKRGPFYDFDETD